MSIAKRLKKISLTLSYSNAYPEMLERIKAYAQKGEFRCCYYENYKLSDIDKKVLTNNGFEFTVGEYFPGHQNDLISWEKAKKGLALQMKKIATEFKTSSLEEIERKIIPQFNEIAKANKTNLLIKLNPIQAVTLQNKHYGFSVKDAGNDNYVVSWE